MVQVCDKCKGSSGILYKFTLKGKKAELCDSCSEKVLSWLKEPIKPTGFLQGVLGR